MAVKALIEESFSNQSASSHEIKVASSREFRAAVIIESGVATPAELSMLQREADEGGCRLPPDAPTTSQPELAPAPTRIRFLGRSHELRFGKKRVLRQLEHPSRA